MEQVLKDFSNWGKQIKLAIQNIEDESEGLDQYQELIFTVHQSKAKNNWFTKSSVVSALTAISSFLDENKLKEWLSNYPDFKYAAEPKNIGIVMAGNIPAVGFHDLLCVLITGNIAKIKCSSEDAVLIPALLNLLYAVNPEWKQKVEVCKDRLTKFDAVIATGSNNSARYFEYYFGKVPNIIRKSRTSLAIVTGQESEMDFKGLQSDIFTYFGLGCRNVNFLLVNKKVSIPDLIPNLIPEKEELSQHNKYLNNLDYNKSIMLLNRVDFYDGGPFLIQVSDQLFSPISVINVKFYDEETEAIEFVNEHKADLQCVVGKLDVCTVGFGKTQTPSLMDYADDIDTLNFLQNLNQ